MSKGEAYLKELDKQYRKAINEIESDLIRWYGRIAENNEINLAQARKWLIGKELDEFKWEIEEYIQYGKQNGINGVWLKQLENASAKAHISRLEALKIQLQQTVEAIYQGQIVDISNTLNRIYQDGYYHTAFEIQKGFNVGWSIPALDSNKVTQILSKPWTSDGSNFSDRIWKAKNDLVNILHTELTQGIIMGRAPDKAIKRIADKFNTSRARAGRLVMTESAFFASVSQRDCFNDLGVERYEIVATLDTKTSEICQGLDGKIFKMSEYEPGLTAPPFHCWCRTTTIPHFNDNFGERIARDESARQYYVSDDMKYSDWKKEYVVNSSLEKLNSGIIDTSIYNLKLKWAKQPEHVIGTKQWKDRVLKAHNQGKSLPGAFYSNIDVQSLIKEYSGTGFAVTKNLYPKEFVNTNDFIGLAYDFKSRKYIKSKRMCIQYSSKGVHAYPVIDNEGSWV